MFPLSDVLPSLAPAPATGCPLSPDSPARGFLPAPSVPVRAVPLVCVARPVYAILPAAGYPVGVARPAYAVCPAAGVPPTAAPRWRVVLPAGGQALLLPLCVAPVRS